MSLVVVLGSLAIVSSVPLALLALSSGRARERRASTNLASGLAVRRDMRAMVLARPVRDRAVVPVLKALANRSRRLTPAGVLAAMEHRLRLAGRPVTPEQFLVVKLAVSVVAVAGGVAWAAAQGTAQAFVVVPAALVAGALLPDYALARRARQRQGRIRNALPDTLDQLTICVEAGLGFDAALAKVASTGHGPLSEELRRALQDVQLGASRKEALRRLTEDTDVAELRQFAHAVSQAESYGVPIAAVLRAQSVEQRDKRSSRAEERAQKMPVKLVFPLVFCILPSLFVVVLGPALLRITRGLG
ncbi:MAG: type II secretion system F family protein [Actinomycetota bacterium]